MSIAWATIVLVVLLLPGFVFFWGFYAPHQVTRETVPTSPLAQLAAVVVFSFAVHAIAYTLLNDVGWCRRPGGVAGLDVPCVDFDQLGVMLRLDSVSPLGRRLPSLNAMLDGSARWILAYFAVTSLLSFALGFVVGKAVERGLLPIARHGYLRMLEEGRRQVRGASDAGFWRALRPSRWPGAPAETRLVRAHVLSRTAHEREVVIYDGVLRDFYAKADGTISYVVLRGARCGTFRIEGPAPLRSTETRPLDAEGDHTSAFLVLTADDIANLYVEPLNAVTQDPDEAAALDEKVRAYERQQQPAPTERGTATDDVLRRVRLGDRHDDAH